MSVAYPGNPSVTTQYEMPDEVMHWQPPICIVCKERKPDYTVLPYGSDFAGENICGDCCHKHFDPIIKTALAEKEGKMNYKDLYNPCELVEWSKIYQSFQNATERAAFAMEKFGRHYEEMTKVMENMCSKANPRS